MIKIINLVKLSIKSDERGSLVFAEALNQIPFSIKRIFYIFNTKNNGCRGYHAHKNNKIVLFCLQGSSLIKLDNGKEKTQYLLDKPNVGIIINNKIWHSMEKFKKNTILLAISSEKYDENDYLRNYNQFKQYLKQK